MNDPPIIILGTFGYGLVITIFLVWAVVYEYFNPSRFVWMYMILPSVGALIVIAFKIIRFCTCPHTSNTILLIRNTC